MPMLRICFRFLKLSKKAKRNSEIMFKQEYTIRLWLIRNVMTAFVAAGFFGVTMELIKMIGGTMDFTLTFILFIFSIVITIFARIIIIHDYVPMVRSYER